MKPAVWLALLVATPLAAQQPVVGYVDVYGARTNAPAAVRAAAGISVGDSVTATLERAARARLLALPGVRAGHVTLVCCENGQSIVYLGIVESAAPAITFAPAPAGVHGPRDHARGPSGPVRLVRVRARVHVGVPARAIRCGCGRVPSGRRGRVRRSR